MTELDPELAPGHEPSDAPGDLPHSELELDLLSALTEPGNDNARRR